MIRTEPAQLLSPPSRSLAMTSPAGPLTLQHNLQGHQQWISDLRFSSLHPHVLASGSDDKTVALWDTTKGELLHRLSGHRAYVRSVCFEPNSHMLASGSEDRTVRLWDAHTGQLARSLPTQSSLVTSVRYSPLCSPGGVVLAVGLYDGTVSIWDRRGVRCAREKRGEGEGHVYDLGYSRDGALLGLGLLVGRDRYSSPGSVEVWDPRTWKSLRQWETSRAVRSLSFASEGSGLNASGLTAGTLSNSSNIEVFDSGKVRSIAGHTGWVRSVHFAPDKGALVSASEDSTVRFWDCGSWTELHQVSPFEDGEVPTSARFSTEGSTLAVGGNQGSLKLWDVSRLRAVQGSPEEARSRRETVAASRATPQQAPFGGKEDSKVQATGRDAGAVPGQATPSEMLDAMAPDFGRAGITVTVLGVVASIDPTKTADALGAMLRSVLQQCDHVLVFKVQAQGLRDRLVSLQPLVDTFGEAVQQDTGEGLVRALLPCLLRVLQVIQSAHMLLHELPSDNSLLIRFLFTLFAASDIARKFTGILDQLSQALLDMHSCTFLAHVTSLSTAESRNTLTAREEGGKDRRELAQQLLAAFDGDMVALKAELEASGWDMQQLRAALQVMGADVQCINGEAQATANEQLREVQGIETKAKLAPPAGLVDAIPFSIEPAELQVERAVSLGGGGFGQVYKGRYRGEPVAVKVCVSRVLDKVQKKRVLREAYIMHKCSAWPGITRLHGVVIVPDESSDLHFAMVTELVEGCTLSELIHDDDEIAPSQLLRWCLQVARAVQYLHLYPPPHGPIVHGDLKPSNIMVCEKRKEVKLIDFGCATMKAVTGSYAKTTVLTAGGLKALRSEYTPGYAAPEILQSICSGDLVERSNRTDVFALGVVFYEVLLRKGPFADRFMGPCEVDAAVCRGERPATNVKKLASFPDAVSLIKRCWHEDPEQRPSMHEICLELEECLAKLGD